MPGLNAEVSTIFSQIADLLEIDEANPFRVRAYRNAARLIGDTGFDLQQMVAEHQDLTKLAGVGKDLAAKIDEIASSGRCSFLDELKQKTSADLFELLRIPGLGPHRVGKIYRELGITNSAELAAAAQDGRIRKLRGFGVEIERKILAALAPDLITVDHVSLLEAKKIAEPLLAYLLALPGVQQAVVAGSYRRRKEIVHDLDVLVSTQRPKSIIKGFLAYGERTQVIAQGDTKAAIQITGGLSVDLRVVVPNNFGAALQYFTGSKAHNIAVRKLGLKRGLKINEYGVYRGDKRIAGNTEESVYEAVGLPWIPPELREDEGEIQAALRGELAAYAKQHTRRTFHQAG